jgi:hypothetical protein
MILRTASSSAYTNTVTVDGGQVFSISGSFDWRTYDLDPNQYLSKGTQHTVAQNDGGGGGYIIHVAIITWAG